MVVVCFDILSTLNSDLSCLSLTLMSTQNNYTPLNNTLFPSDKSTSCGFSFWSLPLYRFVGGEIEHHQPATTWSKNVKNGWAGSTQTTNEGSLLPSDENMVGPLETRIHVLYSYAHNHWKFEFTYFTHMLMFLLLRMPCYLCTLQILWTLTMSFEWIDEFSNEINLRITS